MVEGEGFVSLEHILTALHEEFPQGGTSDSVVSRVCEILGISSRTLSGGSDSLRLWLGRAITAYALREFSSQSWENIANSLQRPEEVVRTLYEECSMFGKVLLDAELHSDPVLDGVTARLVHGNEAAIVGVTPQNVIEEVARQYGVSSGEVLNADNRRRHVTRARHVAMFFLRARGFSFDEIGGFFRCADGSHLSATSARLSIQSVKVFTERGGRIEDGGYVGTVGGGSVAAELRGVPSSSKTFERKSEGFPLVYDRLHLQDAVRGALARQSVTKDWVLKYFSDLTGTSIGEIIGPRRSRSYAAVRAAVANVLYERLGMSLEEVGKVLGDRDHSTIVTSLEQLKRRSMYELCAVRGAPLPSKPYDPSGSKQGNDIVGEETGSAGASASHVGSIDGLVKEVQAVDGAAPQKKSVVTFDAESGRELVYDEKSEGGLSDSGTSGSVDAIVNAKTASESSSLNGSHEDCDARDARARYAQCVRGFPHQQFSTASPSGRVLGALRYVSRELGVNLENLKTGEERGSQETGAIVTYLLTSKLGMRLPDISREWGVSVPQLVKYGGLADKLLKS